ncbi:MAG: hypothetical protein WD402_02085 [Chloroflexota bacterium]
MDDQKAIERYLYLLRTAPPDEIERAHEEAFSRLTPEQRAQVLQELSQEVPASEVPNGDDPGSLARMATRAEMREPGTLERTFGRMQGPGFGGMFLSGLAGAFVGTAIAGAVFDDSDPDAGGDPGGDSDPGDAAEADVGGSDFGGDFGGGDFGGGDFGGI